MPAHRQPSTSPTLGDLPDVHAAGAAPTLGAARRPVPADQLGGRATRARSTLTPPSLHPSIPPFASFFAGHYPESPVGPFSHRAGPPRRARRHPPTRRCASARCATRPAAVDALRDHWGYPVQLGDVAFARRHDQVRFTAALDGRTVVDFAVHTADVINGSRPDDVRQPHLVARRRRRREAGAGRPGVHDPAGRPRAARPCRCPTRRRWACAACCSWPRRSSASRSAPTPTSCRCASRSTVVEPAITSGKRVA